MVDRLVTRTVGLIEREYPNALRLTLVSAPTDVITPRSIHPAFFGCYDWHSAVHSHWQIVRALRVLPGWGFAAPAAAALDRTLTPENVAVEMAWVADRAGFEMPYGMAWLLRLSAELRDWDDDRARRWLDTLRPLETHAGEQFERYCSALTRPVRGGMHNQSAFSLGLVLDSTHDRRLREAVAETVVRFFGHDTDVDQRVEPSAADFLSPSLSEADAMRRVLPAGEFGEWLDGFAPHGFRGLRPVEVVDPSDGQLAHWAGLNLSRSWMMGAVADALPSDHRLVDDLRASAAAHAAAGLETADHADYMIAHWVPTFAVYLLTGASGTPVG